MRKAATLGGEHLSRTLVVRGLFWFGFYLVLILFPLLVGWLRHPPEVEGRAFSLQFSVACGYVGLSVMAFEFVLISRVSVVSSAFGQDVLLKFHRQMGVVATVLIAAHAVLIFRNGYPVSWLNPIGDGVVKWGVLSGYTLVLLIVLSLARRSLGIPYQWWQITHSFLANAAVLLGVVHVLNLGSFAGPMAMKELWAVYLLLLFGLFLQFRLFKPLTIWKKPWKVIENIQERGESRTIVLKPAGHEGFNFEPGQFAWLNTGRTPFSRDQHPISLSSCAWDEPGREVSFTVKALGDWSAKTVPDLQPGGRVWLDGPYGVFSSDREQGFGYILIAGGVGITPFYSMCLTFAERGDVRPIILFYAGNNFDGLTFRDQLDALQTKLNLKIVYVLASPDPAWEGERGYISRDVLQRHLPRQFKRMQYFVCGPTPMMDAMEKVLPAIGVPAHLIHTERFNMV